MNEDLQARILENSLERLLAGEPLEKILADTPHEGFDSFEDELIQAAEAARLAAVLAPSEKAPALSQANSKAAFLAAAGEQHKQLRGHWLAWLWKPARLAPLTAVLIVALVWTGLASAQALPGDSLFGLKVAAQRTRILLTTDPVQKVELETRYNEDRVSEIELMAEHDHESEVTFSGFVSIHSDGSWYIDNIRLEFPAGLPLSNSLFDGAYVMVHGLPAGPELLLVEDLELRVVIIIGSVNAVDDREWQIDGRDVVITGRTRVDMPAKVGDKVEVTAARIENDLYEGIEIRKREENSGGDSQPGGVVEPQNPTAPAETQEPEVKKTELKQTEAKAEGDPTNTPAPEKSDSNKSQESNPEPDSTATPAPESGETHND